MDNQKTKFRLGDTVISIDNNNSISDRLLEDFSFLQLTNKDPDIIFNINKGYSSNSVSKYQVGRNYFSEDKIFIDKSYQNNLNSPLDYLRHKAGNLAYQTRIDVSASVTEVDLYIDKMVLNKPKSSLNKGLKFRNWTYMYRYEVLAKNIIYNRFEPIIQNSLCKNGQSYLHASGVSKNDQATLIAGRGGAGKTSLSTMLMEKENYSFMADDFSIIDKEGFAYPYSKSIVCYPYNLQNQQELKQKILTDSKLDKFHFDFWKKIKGEKGVRRRVKPEEIYENTTNDKKEIKRIIWLQRWNKDELELQDISEKQLAYAAAGVLSNELSNLLDIFEEAHTFPDIEFADYKNLINKTEDIYKECFSNTDLKLVRVPKRYPPEKLYNKLSEEIDF